MDFGVDEEGSSDDASSVMDMDTLLAPVNQNQNHHHPGVSASSSHKNEAQASPQRVSTARASDSNTMDTEFLQSLQDGDSDGDDSEQSTGLLQKQLPRNQRLVDQSKESPLFTSKNVSATKRTDDTKSTGSTIVSSQTRKKTSAPSQKRPAPSSTTQHNNQSSSIRLEFGSSLQSFRAQKSKNQESTVDHGRIVVVNSSGLNNSLVEAPMDQVDLRLDGQQATLCAPNSSSNDDEATKIIHTGKVRNANHSPFVNCVALWNEAKQCYIVEVVTHLVDITQDDNPQAQKESSEEEATDLPKRKSPPSRTIIRPTRRQRTR